MAWASAGVSPTAGGQRGSGTAGQRKASVSGPFADNHGQQWRFRVGSKTKLRPGRQGSSKAGSRRTSIRSTGKPGELANRRVGHSRLRLRVTRAGPSRSSLVGRTTLLKAHTKVLRCEPPRLSPLIHQHLQQQDSFEAGQPASAASCLEPRLLCLNIPEAGSGEDNGIDGEGGPGTDLPLMPHPQDPQSTYLGALPKPSPPKSSSPDDNSEVPNLPQIHLIMFGEEGEGVYSLTVSSPEGDCRDSILAFEQECDAEKYKRELVRASVFGIADKVQVCTVPPSRVATFCHDSGYACQLQRRGSMLFPPDSGSLDCHDLHRLQSATLLAELPRPCGSESGRRAFSRSESLQDFSYSEQFLQPVKQFSGALAFSRKSLDSSVVPLRHPGSGPLSRLRINPGASLTRNTSFGSRRMEAERPQRELKPIAACRSMQFSRCDSQGSSLGGGRLGDGLYFGGSLLDGLVEQGLCLLASTSSADQ